MHQSRNIHAIREPVIRLREQGFAVRMHGIGQGGGFELHCMVRKQKEFFRVLCRSDFRIATSR